MVNKGNKKSEATEPAATSVKPIGKTEGRGRPKQREGLVVSDKMDKTIVVAVTRQVRHAKYGKFIRKTTKYMAHDERQVAGIGDLVRIVETRPMSRHKRWKLHEVLAVAD
jgi:small subunit ribosomal protein S17